MPLGGPYEPAAAAKFLAWRASEKNSQTIFIDGGADAVIRGDSVWKIAGRCMPRVRSKPVRQSPRHALFSSALNGPRERHVLADEIYERS